MKLATLFVCLGAFTATIASAAGNYSVKLFNPVSVGGKELKAGTYKVEVNGDNVTIKGEGATVQTHATSMQNGSKYAANTVRYRINGDKFAIEEIRLGGTSTKLVFNGSSPANE